MTYKFQYWGNNTKEILRLIHFNTFMLILRKWKHSGFMNIGYSGVDFPFKLMKEDEENKKHIALYVKALEPNLLTFNSVLEIGSGLGGGCYILKKYYNFKNIIGIDYLKANTYYCNKQKKYIGIEFINSSAEDLNRFEKKFDLIISIEAGLFFYNWDAFINNIPSLLNLNGQFIYEDLIVIQDIPLIEEKIKTAGLKIIHSENISQGVINSIKGNLKPQKNPSKLYKLIKKILNIKKNEEFEAYENSRIFNDLVGEQLRYMKYVLVLNQ